MCQCLDKEIAKVLSDYMYLVSQRENVINTGVIRILFEHPGQYG